MFILLLLAGQALSPDGKTLATADRLVLRLSGAATATLIGHSAAVTALTFLPDGRLVSAAADGRVRVWDVRTQRATRAMTVSEGPLVAVAASPDGSFAVASEEGAHVYDADSGFRRLLLRGPAHAVAYSPDGRTLAVGRGAGEVELWEVATGGRRGRLLGGGRDAVERLAFGRDGRALAFGTRGELRRLWAIASPRPLAEAWEALDGKDAAKAYRAMWSLALSPDGVALLAREMKDVAADAKARRDRVARLIADLDADEFVAREKASAALAALGGDVYHDLEQALRAKPPLEQHRRLERLLRDMTRPADPLPLGLVRRLRAVEALEYAGRRDVIERLAEAEDERLKASARASLARLKKQGP